MASIQHACMIGGNRSISVRDAAARFNGGDESGRIDHRRECGSGRPLPPELVLDVGADDVVEALLGLEAEALGPAGVELARPALDDLDDHRVRLAPDAVRDLVAGEACQWRTSSATGSTASSPASGSRMMPEKKPEAALLGLPGRTQIVGSRMPMPSKKPRRE